jgi:hypothetical protein
MTKARNGDPPGKVMRGREVGQAGRDIMMCNDSQH